MHKTTLGLLLILAVSTVLAGCNTVAGAGKDIKNAGEGIQNSAEKHTPEGDE